MKSSTGSSTAMRSRAHSAKRWPSAASVTGGGSCGGFGAFLRQSRSVWNLAKQVVVKHLARDRRCGGSTETAVLHEDGERDTRLFGRRESDEKRMVAMALGHLFFVVLLVLLDADHLGGAGFATDLVRHALE